MCAGMIRDVIVGTVHPHTTACAIATVRETLLVTAEIAANPIPAQTAGKAQPMTRKRQSGGNWRGRCGKKSRLISSG